MTYITQEERKKPLTHSTEGFRFSCDHLDLSAPVHVSSDFYAQYSPAQLSKAVACFIAWWMLWVHKTLNGFSGIDCIEWKFDGQSFTEV